MLATDPVDVSSNSWTAEGVEPEVVTWRMGSARFSSMDRDVGLFGRGRSFGVLFGMVLLFVRSHIA